MKDRLLAILFCLLLGAVGGIIGFFCMGCNTFKIVESGISDECDVYYTTMRYYAAQKEDSAFLGIVYSPCAKSLDTRRAEKKERSCREIHFPDNIIDKTNYQLYNQYLECLKQ